MTSTVWFTNDTVADAVAEATATSKPLFVDFWYPTCLGCAKLFAITYPDERVDALLANEFVCVKYNVKHLNQWFRKLTGTVAHLWTPDVMVMSERLMQVRRFSGYLPPARFAAELRFGLGLWHLHNRRAADAGKHLTAVAEADDAGVAAPEALYWAGVAAYFAGGLDALVPHWERLGAEYPTSDWVLRADILNVEIPSDGFVPDDPSTVRIHRRAFFGAAH